MLFMFAGCSSKVNPYITSKDILHEQAITQTRKTTIKSDKNVKVYITATYLNQIKHELAGENKNLERFIVSVYIPNYKNKKLYKNISIKINDINKNLSIKELNKNDPILKILSSSSIWTKYYLVEIPSIKAKILTLNIEYLFYDSANMSFQKDYL